MRSSIKIARHNLPVPLTSFIGRDQQITEIRRCLTSTRLVTLAGTGGIGKTRLALQVAAAEVAAFRDGVWWVELGALRRGWLVPKTVAAALGVSRHSRRPMRDSLVHFLREKSLLLVLDNCEHLLSACSKLVAALLRECPSLRVLATSREPLGIAGELAYLVPPLLLPPPSRDVPLGAVVSNEAARLFIERATAARPTFTVTANDAPVLADICRQLEGFPLAIELAAVRAKLLSVQQIASRLDDRFHLLTAGARTAPPRHQTLKATIDWSYGLLSEEERSVFRRLSIFNGGWTLEAAEVVCSGAPAGRHRILDLLQQLVDKSLVIAETQADDARFHLLDTLRQYARDRLREAGEERDVRRRHLTWYLSLAEQADQELRGPRQMMWLRKLAVEHDNMLAALDWTIQGRGDVAAGLRLAGALQWFWWIHGHWREGRWWLDAALARGEGVAAHSSLLKVLHGAAILAWRQGAYGRASELCRRGFALCRGMRDRGSAALFLMNLGNVALLQGDHHRAMAVCEESLALCRAVADDWLLGLALAQLGSVERVRGDLGRAEGCYTRSLRLFMRVGDKFFTASTLRSLGLVKTQQGDHGRAAALYSESLVLCRLLGDRWVTQTCLEGMAIGASAQGHHEGAMRLLGAAETLRDLLGLRRRPISQDPFGRTLASVRARLREPAASAAWDAGSVMPLEQAIDYALAIKDGFVRDIEQSGGSARSGLALLTPREREVAARVAEGLSDREIAYRLRIAERTAETHVHHILERLELRSRSQIAVWAVDQGLRSFPAPRPATGGSSGLGRPSASPPVDLRIP